MSTGHVYNTGVRYRRKKSGQNAEALQALFKLDTE